MTERSPLESRISLIQELCAKFIFLIVITLSLVGCNPPSIAPIHVPTSVVTPTIPAPTDTLPPGIEGLADDEIATLSSLEKIDNSPLYTMRYYGAYSQVQESTRDFKRLADGHLQNPSTGWACSLFAALGSAENGIYGRNFDWEHSPAVLLFTDPPDGYASVSMVDIAYLGFTGVRAETLLELPLNERRALLEAPGWPFDGMNEHGLTIGMAAVPDGKMRPDPSKKTIGSLEVMREILDHAQNLDEAIAIFQRYNIDFGGGPALHYLVAGPAGHAVLVEFYEGKMILIPNSIPWHQATNFLRASVDVNQDIRPFGRCWRYDMLSQEIDAAQGEVSPQLAMDLLSSVAQPNTQWSIVYGMHTGEMNVVMNRQFQQVHTFYLRSGGED